MNACVVDAHYHARNAPWVVDIELPCQEVDERYPKETDEGQVPDEDAVELTKTENENSV